MPRNVIADYLAQSPNAQDTPGALAYVANLATIAHACPDVAAGIVRELIDQRGYLKLIASENYCSLATQLAMGNLLTDKYAEGVPNRRFYAGCANVDAIETAGCEEAKDLFGAEHAYLQPHSGADANLIAYWAILATRVQAPEMEKFGETNPAKLSAAQWAHIRQITGEQRLLGMDYYSGGHLTHGYRMNVSAQMFDAHTYSVNRETGLLDYAAIEAQARELRPLILLCGYSAYPRRIDFSRMREIADQVGAVLMVDMAHFAGLVAGKAFTGVFNPIPYADVVTTTTHKTLRGPRGGIILCRQEFAAAVDKGCPMVIGGPLPHVIAAKTIALKEANTPAFADYARRIIANAEALARACAERGMQVMTGGTDNHLLLLNVTPFGINGRQGEKVLRECGITLNRNSLPFDPNGPWYTSGLRLGTPAVTTLGMGPDEMETIAEVIHLVLDACKPAPARDGKPSRSNYRIPPEIVQEAQNRVHTLLNAFPVYPELDVNFLSRSFIPELKAE